MTAAYRSMRNTVGMLRRAAPAAHARHIIIGGGMIDQEVASFVGGDTWTVDAMEGVRICQRLLGHE